MNSPIHLSLETDNHTQQRLTVEANTRQDGERSLTLRLEVGGADQNSIVLSVEEARALSLAIISVVNKHEQHAHTRRNQSNSNVALYPVTR